MTILEKSGDLSKRTIFKLTEGKNTTKVSDAVGMQIKVSCWIIYEDVDARGETMEVLSIQGSDGEIYTTISNVFKKSFDRIVETFGDEDIEIIILDGQTKNGRTYYDCTIV